MSTTDTRETIHLTLQPAKGVETIPALRAALKRLWRCHGLRAVEVRVNNGEPADGEPKPAWAADAEGGA